MKVFLALIIALGLGSCAQNTEHMYAGIVIEYQNGKAVDAHLLGVAFSKAKCEAGVKSAAAVANSEPSDGSHYVVGCAEFVPLISADGVSK
jgi:hypothetical protein